MKVGHKEEAAGKGAKWSNAFWESIYNEAAKKLNVVVNDDTTEEQSDSSIAIAIDKEMPKVHVPIRKEIRKIKLLKSKKQH